MPDCFLGIDFGTSSCSIAVARKDPRLADAAFIDARLVRFPRGDGADDSVRLPTVLSAHIHDKRQKRTALIGWEFFKRFFQRGKKPPLLRHGRDFFRSVKSDLGSHCVYPWAFSSDFNTPVKVAAAILKHLLDEAKRDASGRDLRQCKCVVTVPASLGAAAREDTRKAAIAAGLREDQFEFLDEPIAALLDLLNKPEASDLLSDEPSLLAVFDYGGGTLDISLVRARFDSDSPGGVCVENVAISMYSRLGGDAIDREVMDQVVWPQIEVSGSGIDRDSLDAAVRASLEDTFVPTVARELKERMCREVSQRLRDGKSWDAIDRSKISVEAGFDRSSPAVAGVSGRLPPRYKMSREEFESVMQAFVSVPTDFTARSCGENSLLAPLLDVLRKAQLKPEDLKAVVLHGGSTRNPYVDRLLRETIAHPGSLFSDVELTRTPDPDASVARGAAIACYWKHARGVERVTPVVPEDIGVVTLGNQCVCLVKGGTRLPFPDADGVHTDPTEFAVPHDRQSTLIVPFYTGQQRFLSGTVKIQLPAEIRRGAPVRLKLRIDHDKILQWWCSIGNAPYAPQPAINDPWTARRLTPAARRLADDRMAMERELEQTGELRLSMHIEEAIRLWEARHLDDLRTLISDLREVPKDVKSEATLANLEGLVRAVDGDNEGAESAHRRAVELSPTQPVYCGNLGYVLADVGKTDEAIAKMREALSLDPSLTYLYERLGDLYRKSGDEAAARREFDEAIRRAEGACSRFPHSSLAWSTLDRLYRTVGLYDKARDARGRLDHALQDELYEGDHTQLIAGPDSGYLPSFPQSE